MKGRRRNHSAESFISAVMYYETGSNYAHKLCFLTVLSLLSIPKIEFEIESTAKNKLSRSNSMYELLTI